MRKLMTLLTVFVLSCGLAFGQNRQITGKVRNDKGENVPFASILVKGTKNSAVADAEGNYQITAKTGDILVITATGEKIVEESVSSSNMIVTTMTQARGELEEVVVTGAFGIKKSQRNTAFSSQVIKAEDLNIVRQTNVNSALAGKVAGVQTRSQSAAKLDEEAFLRIRGGLGLGERSAIYVVDGTITGSFDINPDDIEDITVLKGANATALLGSQATGGAIIITTKKKVGRGTGVGIEVNTGVTFDKAYILPQYQNLYAGGGVADLKAFKWQSGMPAEWKALDGQYFHDYTDDASWGPRMVGQQHIPWYAWFPGHADSYKTTALNPQPDNARDFWQTGITSTNNLSFGKSGSNYTYRASYTNQYIKGALPNSSSSRNTVNLSGSFDLNSHFTIASNITFSSNVIKGTFEDGYANNSQGSFNQWFHRDLDMDKMKSLSNVRSPYGTYGTWNLRFNPDGYNPAAPQNFYKANYWYNFYSYFDELINRQDRNRMFGDIGLTYKINQHFKIRGTLRRNQLMTYNEGVTPSILEESALQTGVLGGYSTSSTNLQRMDYELIGFYNNTFGDFAVSSQFGGNIYTNKYNDVSASTNQGLNVPGLYAISNSKANPNVGNNRQQQQVNSLFGSFDLEYKKFVSLTFAGRQDWGSTLSPSKPSLFYPSAGASFIVSQLFPNRPSWFSFAKVFGSWGKKPESLGLFQTNFAYSVNPFQWGSNFLMSTPNNFPDPRLQGALIQTIEAGIDIKFLKNRLGLNVVYFDEVADKIPVNVQLSGVSGFSSTSVNAAKVERQGIEIVLNGRLVSNKNFTWDMSTNFSYLIKNPVSQIIDGQDQILLEGGAFGTRMARAFQVKGKDWGQLIGGGMKRNADGIPLVNPATGQYIRDEFRNWGSIVPKVNGGFLSNIAYKQFTFGFSLDYQVGGKFFSLSEMWGHFSGLMAKTAALNDKGVNVRTAVADGGGVKVTGVSSVDQKTPVDVYVDAQTYFHNFYFDQIAEPYVHSLSYVKLRDVSIGYNIPVKKIGNLGKYFQGAHFSLVARNAWLIWSDAKNFDPSEISNTYGEDGNFPGTRGIGFNLKLSF